MTLSFAVLFTAFLIYDILAVPMIEPAVSIASPSATNWAAEDTSTQHIRSVFAELFPQGAWERNNPKVLKTTQGTLLFRDYQTLQNNRLKLEPLTLVIYIDGQPSQGRKQKNNPIVLKAPEGAVLQFDGALDLSQGKIGNLIAGELTGEITIHSQESARGAEDDLFITTRMVTIDKQRLYTTSSVAFRFGRNHGSGRDLSITFDPPNVGESNSRRKGLGNVRSLELLHVDLFNLMTSYNGPLIGDVIQDPSNLEKSAPVPIKVTCGGSLQFDFRENIASLSDDVRVERNNTNETVDLLTCQLLAIHFQKRRSITDTSSILGDSNIATTETPSQQLNVKKLVAVGSPARLEAPSYDTSVVGTHLEYDIFTRRLHVEDQNAVVLRHGVNSAQAPIIDYQLTENPQRLGILKATGPGSLSIGQSETKRGHFVARWEDSIQLLPDGDRHRLSISSKAYVRAEERGQFSGDQLHVWLREQPKHAVQQQPIADTLSTQATQNDDWDIVPEKLLAIGSVQIDSPRLSGQTERVEAWFVSPNSPTADRLYPTQSSSSEPGLASNANLFAPQASSQQTPLKYNIQGDLIQLQMVRQANEYALEDLTIVGNVELSQTLDRLRPQTPLRVIGTTLRLQKVTSPSPKLQIAGNRKTRSPAQVRAQGMVVRGDIISLDQGQNMLVIDGRGEVDFSDLTNPTPEVKGFDGEIRLRWSEGMQFDGWKATATGRIQVNGSKWVNSEEQIQFTGKSRALTVVVNDFVDFKNPPQEESIKVHQLFLHDQVDTENRTFDRQGIQKSFDRMQIRDLAINQLNGHFHANGPGWIKTVRYAKDATEQSRPTTITDSQKASELIHIHVDYNREIVGNFENREVTFSNQVKAIYGPVDFWEATITEQEVLRQWGKGALLTCEQLSIVEMQSEQKHWVELIAGGNTKVEGLDKAGYFTALAHRIKYSQAKEMLLLEGDGRRDAILKRRKKIGAEESKIAAQRITYWPKTDNFDLQEADTLEFFD